MSNWPSPDYKLNKLENTLCRQIDKYRLLFNQTIGTVIALLVATVGYATTSNSSNIEYFILNFIILLGVIYIPWLEFLYFRMSHVENIIQFNIKLIFKYPLTAYSDILSKNNELLKKFYDSKIIKFAVGITLLNIGYILYSWFSSSEIIILNTLSSLTFLLPTSFFTFYMGHLTVKWAIYRETNIIDSVSNQIIKKVPLNFS